MGERTCSVDGCKTDGKRRGLCFSHYRRWRLYGAPLGEPESASYARVCVCGVRFTAASPRATWCSEACRVRHKTDTPCAVADCASSAVRRGWCGRHYARWYRNGDPLVATQRDPLPALCSIDGCTGDRYARGWCAVHYGRWANHDSTDERVIDAPCIDCGVVFIRGAQGSAPRCEQCRKSKMREHARRRSYLIRSAEADPAWVPFDRVDVFERDNYVCQWCFAGCDQTVHHMHPMAPTLDHKHPLARGGSHTFENAQTMHRRCNTSKGARIFA